MRPFAFERYFNHSGLLGTPDRCAQMVERMRAVGVDEIASLVDFGVDGDSVRDSLQHLSQLCQRYDPEKEIGA